MRVVVCEDDDAKWSKIKSCLLEKGVRDASILRVDHVSQLIKLHNAVVDLFIIDLLMPSVLGGKARSAGLELLQMLDYSGQRRVPVVAITAYPEEASDLRADFARHGCLIYDFQEEEIWSQALDIFLAQSRERGRYDFIIFTALKEERDAYLQIPGIRIEGVVRNGLDVWELEFAGTMGAIVLFPRMGLVNAAVIVARTLELYTPRVVAMSGICAGIGTDVELGQLLVTDIVWEYQAGKWLEEMFLAEPYQTGVSEATRVALSSILGRDTLLADLEKLHSGADRPSRRSPPRLAVFATGSAVIADAKRLDAVKQQHRKVSGLDMELFGFHRAVELSGQTLHALSAKVVVDKANVLKDDALHEYGCVVSAGFVLESIGTVLTSVCAAERKSSD